MTQLSAAPKRVSVTTLVWSIVGTAVGTAFVVGTIAVFAFVLLLPAPTVAPRGSAAAPAPHSSAETTESPAASDESDGPATQFDGGVVVVGTDVAPGTYSTEGPEDFCFFAWKDGLGSDAENISYRTVSSGKATVELADGDIFQSNGCTPWAEAR